MRTLSTSCVTGQPGQLAVAALAAAPASHPFEASELDRAMACADLANCLRAAMAILTPAERAVFARELYPEGCR